MRVVALEREVFVGEGENVIDRRIELHRRERARWTIALLACLLEGIPIQGRGAAGGQGPPARGRPRVAAPACVPGPDLPLIVRPCAPDVDFVRHELADAGRAAQEPE